MKKKHFQLFEVLHYIFLVISKKIEKRMKKCRNCCVKQTGAVDDQIGLERKLYEEKCEGGRGKGEKIPSVMLLREED